MSTYTTTADDCYQLAITTDPFQFQILKHDLADHWPVIAARTSTMGDLALADDIRVDRLIDRLIADRHGVPFEHMGVTVRLTALLTTWEQLAKHRAGVSMSRESGRYRKFDPVFYIPGPARPLTQVGKPMDYDMRPGTDEQRALVDNHLHDSAVEAVNRYNALIDAGVTREVARWVLPQNLMTTGVLTINARALMHLLSLRTEDAGASIVSHPQYEIAAVAKELEYVFADYAPHTHAAFHKHGRVAP